MEGIPPVDELREIIECAGGVFVPRLPIPPKAGISPKKLIVIGSAAAAQKDVNAAGVAAATNGVGMFAPEMLYRGVMSKRLDLTTNKVEVTGAKASSTGGAAASAARGRRR